MKRNNHSNQLGEFVPGRRTLSWTLSCTLVIPFAIFAVSLFLGNLGTAAGSFGLIALATWLILSPGGLFDIETRAIKAARARPAGIRSTATIHQPPLVGRDIPTDAPPPRASRIA